MINVQFTKTDIINHLTSNSKETKIYKAKIRRNIRESKKHIIIDILTFLWEYFIKCRKYKNRSILNDVSNYLNRIDFYLH